MKNKTLTEWKPEENEFWETTGNKIAYRNLWASIPALLLAFSVWMVWSIIIVQMQNSGYTFGLTDPSEIKSLLYSLPAIAGLSGATLRIPNSFLIAISGGRNVILLSTGLLLIPTIGIGIALQDKNTSYFVFAILALLSGFGGGNFASSMSNITTFFPKKVQGLALGLNAGLGNLGVSVMQVLIPFTMTFPVLFFLSGEPTQTLSGQLIYIQNSGLTWVPIILLSCVLIYFLMNNLQPASPYLKTTIGGYSKSILLLSIGLITSALSAYLLIGLKISMWVVLPLTILLTLILMKLFSPKEIQPSIKHQYSIFTDKHNWVMTILYIMTFGSFIGFSAAFPKLIQDVFGYLPDGSINPTAPSPFMYAFIGPLMGAFIRPLGGWISDKVKSGSKVTQFSTLLQIISAVALGYVVLKASEAQNPTEYWWPFFLLFMLQFIGAGIGNGSTFRSIPYIFEKSLTGPVLGWTSAIGAYGAFMIPQIFGQQIANKTPENAMIGFAIFYFLCLVINWYYYTRKNSGMNC